VLRVRPRHRVPRVARGECNSPYAVLGPDGTAADVGSGLPFRAVLAASVAGRLPDLDRKTCHEFSGATRRHESRPRSAERLKGFVFGGLRYNVEPSRRAARRELAKTVDESQYL
jgi:hypothetical protein